MTETISCPKAENQSKCVCSQALLRLVHSTEYMNPEDIEEKNLGASLIESVGASSLSEIAGEAAEIALDSTLKDGLLKDIPVFGWFFKAYSAYHSITDRMFLKKVALFLSGVSEASENEREKFRNDLNNDVEFRKKVGENLLLLINKHERLEKSYLLGKLMAKVIEEKCSNELFLRLAAALDRATVEDLEDLKKHWQSIKNLPESVQQGLYKCGLLDMKINAVATDIMPHVSASINYKLNIVGEKLIEYGLTDNS